MRSIYVNFVPSTRWHFVWGLTFALCVLAGLFVIQECLRLSMVIQETEHAGEQMRALLAASPMQKQVTTPADVLAAQHALVDQLSRDINPIFATIEALAIEDIRLQALSFDSASGRVRLAYDARSLSAINAVTEALNAGHENPAWALEGVTRTTPVNSSVMVTASLQYGFKASWVATYRSLQ